MWAVPSTLLVSSLSFLSLSTDLSLLSCPLFSTRTPALNIPFSHVNQPQARSLPLCIHLTNVAHPRLNPKERRLLHICTYFHNAHLPKLGPRNRGRLHPPSADSRCDWIAYRRKNPHFLVIFLSFPPSLSLSAP